MFELNAYNSFFYFIFLVISRVLFLDAGVEINIIKQQIQIEVMLSFVCLDDIYVIFRSVQVVQKD